MALPSYLHQDSLIEATPSLRHAAAKAQEAYGDAQNAIYNEGEASNCESAKELNLLLRDHAERVASVFENAYYDCDDRDASDLEKFNELKGKIECDVTEALEDEVPSEVKEELGL